MTECDINGDEATNKVGICEAEETLGGPVFVPKLYIQRYYFVLQQLIKHNVKSIVDFGSAKCKISRFLVKIPSAEKIALVDIDGGLLKTRKFMIRPQTCDFLVRREHRLSVKMYEGSVTQFDDVIAEFDAVTMVEIIEHLYPDMLCAAYKMIFGKMRPRVVVMTTPNADYNQLFPGFSGFRHWDHKFEWTRNEFKSWCDDITAKYPYTVELTGIGDAPKHSQHLGYCSQAAIFVRHTETTQACECSDTTTNSYRLIAWSSYPYKQGSDIPEDESLLMEISYLLNAIAGTQPDKCEEYWEETDLYHLVPISILIKNKKLNTKFDLDQFREYLRNHGYRISEDNDHILFPVPEDDCDISTYSDNDDNNQDGELYCTPSNDSAVCCDNGVTEIIDKNINANDYYKVTVPGSASQSGADCASNDGREVRDEHKTQQFIIECSEYWD